MAATDLSPVDVEDDYAALFDALNAKLEAMMTQFIADATNVPANTLRLNPDSKRWERWSLANGEWAPAIDRYAIDVEKLGGKTPAVAANPNTVAVRDAQGRLKAGVPRADDDVLRAMELATHLQGDNPHGIDAKTVGLDKLTNKLQLEASQNLADLPNKTAAKGPSGLNLGDAADRNVGTQNGRLVQWQDVPRPADATTAIKGLSRFGTAAEHQNGSASVAATPAGVRIMGYIRLSDLFNTVDNVTNYRSKGATYTNNKQGPIFVAVTGINSYRAWLEAFVDGVLVQKVRSSGENGFNTSVSISIVVPPGSSYRMGDGGTSTTIEIWTETY